MSAKVDATAGSATAHSDNTAVGIGLGLYEIDWPDAVWLNRTAGTVIELVVEWDPVNHYVVAQQVQIETVQTGDAYVPALAAQAAAEAAYNYIVNTLVSLLHSPWQKLEP